MNVLPQSEDTLFVRTDFSDEAAWQALRTVVETPAEAEDDDDDDEEFLASLHIVDDPAYRDLTAEQVLALTPAEDSLVVIADNRALTEAEMPLLAVYTGDEDDDAETEKENDGRKPSYQELRVVATELHSIENNISMANMDWEEFVNAAEEGGVFRGF
ncbi:hypothetical protein [Streptomyces sp. E5N91]|uniref:DUF6924 domain-containing protein n=1 Tax=Streptomyces sp. E5N91 TaxID=1851996 RepID=UPI000EF5ED23|nr:hypothetical protein [Streptomyces sp. E5N91]